MSFFAKAVIQALKDVPAVNAEIDGEDLVYKNYYHLGVAVGTEKGLVVRGKLSQSGVPRSFISPVPLYANVSGHNTYLGTVTTSGPETSFHFLSSAIPHKLLIDPQMTLLCVTE